MAEPHPLSGHVTYANIPVYRTRMWSYSSIILRRYVKGL